LFESIKAYNGRVFKLREHVDRLYDSAKAIAMDIRLTKDEMIEIILETRGKTILKMLIFAL
jgi:branched-chain amino acid aminotransferase